MDKYERILFIDKMISSGRRPSQSEIIEALRKECGSIDRTTVWRDLKDLEEKFHAPLDYVEETGANGKVHKAYFYTEPTFRVPAMFSGEDKIKSAQLMIRLLDSVKGTPIYDEAREVFSELGTEAPSVDSRGSMKFSLDSAERIIFIGSPCVEIPAGTWRTVEESVQKNRILKFEYRSKIRTVAPYQLIFSKGNWNLWCYDYEKKTRRLFTLSEMTGVRFKSGRDKEFVLPEDFDFRLVTPGYFGTFFSDEECEVRVRMRSYAAKYARCRTWGENQSVRELPDGCIELSFVTTQFPRSSPNIVGPGGPILTWILGWGEDAVPLAPPELVGLWRKRVDAMNRASAEISHFTNAD